MKLTLLLAGGIAFASAVFAQELVTIPTRPGVTLPFFIANMGGRKPEAAALLLIGGGGHINLRHEGRIKFGDLNFLPRSRREFIRNAILPVILDAADIRAVVGEIKKRYPGLPVFVVGTSRSTFSAAHLAVALDGEIAGVVLSASYFYGGGRAMVPMLTGFDWSRVKMPLLLVHHVDDGCPGTPYRDAARLGRRFPLVSVEGGKPPESGPCDPLAPHGFFGREAETVDAIAGWMLNKPYAREIR